MRALKIISFGVIFCCMAEAAHAGPQFFVYQGRYLNNGIAATGNVVLEFRVTNGGAVACGAALPATNLFWTSGVQTVNLSSGVFSYKLGLLSDQATQDPNFLAINWGASSSYFIDVCASGVSLSPHEPIGGTAYALYSSSGSYAIFASTSGGLANSVDAVVMADSGNVGAGVIRLRTGTSDKAVLTNAGNLGIGTTAPAAKLDVQGTGGINVQYGVAAATANFTGTGAAQFSVNTSSGINVNGGGGVYASFFTGTFYGSGAGLTGVTGATDPTKVFKAGDTMTGQLTLAGSTLTVTGNAFSVGATSLAVIAGNVGINVSSPTTALDVNGASTIRDGETVVSSLTVLGMGNPVFSVTTSSGINVGNGGGVYATFFSGAFYGSGAGLTGIVGSDPTKVAKGGDTMTGQLTLASASTLTVTGNAFSVGTSTFVIISGNAGFRTVNPTTVLDVNGASTIRGGQTVVSSSTILGNESVGGNLGVGTTSPTTLLDVNGVATVRGAETVVSSLTVSGNGGVIGNLGVGTTAPTTLLDVGGVTTVRGAETVTSSLTVSGNISVGGNLGVGTTGPGSLLDVNGQSSFRGAETVVSSLTVLGSVGISAVGARFGVGTTSPAASLHVSSGSVLIDGNAGKLEVSYNTAPTLSSCGGAGVLIIGSDVAGKVTIGAGGSTVCAITFQTAYARSPICIAADETSATLIKASASTTALTLNASIAVGDIVDYICIGQR